MKTDHGMYYKPWVNPFYGQNVYTIDHGSKSKDLTHTDDITDVLRNLSLYLQPPYDQSLQCEAILLVPTHLVPIEFLVSCNFPVRRTLAVCSKLSESYPRSTNEMDAEISENGSLFVHPY